MLIDKRSIQNGTVEVGYPIAQKDQYRLVELPAETGNGIWRVWVDENMTLDDGLEAAE